MIEHIDQKDKTVKSPGGQKECTGTDHKCLHTGGWRDALGLKALAVLSEGLGLILSTHTRLLTAVCNSTSRGLTPSSGFLRHQTHK